MIKHILADQTRSDFSQGNHRRFVGFRVDQRIRLEEIDLAGSSRGESHELKPVLDVLEAVFYGYARHGLALIRLSNVSLDYRLWLWFTCKQAVCEVGEVRKLNQTIVPNLLNDPEQHVGSGSKTLV